MRAMPANFIVALNIETKRWPFKWGPFGGRRELRVSCASGDVAIYQRSVDEYREPIRIDLYEGPVTLTSTVSFTGSSRLKRTTYKEAGGK